MATQNADLDRVLDTLATFAEAIQAINDESNFLPMDKYNLHVRAACNKPTFRYAVTQLLRRYRVSGAFDPSREVLLTLLMPVMYAVIQKLAMWFTRSSASMQKLAKRVSTAFQAFAGLAVGANPEPYIPADTPGIYVDGNKPPRQRDLVGEPATMAAPPGSDDDDDDDDEDDSEYVDDQSSVQPQPQALMQPQMQAQTQAQTQVPAQAQAPKQVPIQVPLQVPMPPQTQAPMQVSAQVPRQPAMTQTSTRAEMQEYVRQTQQQPPPSSSMPIQVPFHDSDGVSLTPP